MLTTTVCASDRDESFRQLAEEIRSRHRSQLRELKIEIVEGGVILSGMAASFYGKQIAFHEASDRYKLLVKANQITVHPRD